ncbi:MAG: hypothetical protein EAZ40_09125, partial [Rhodobacterales bacterium]
LMDDSLIPRFAGRNAAYYARAFAAIQSRSGPVVSFNPVAAIFGPLWAGARGFRSCFFSFAFWTSWR